MSTRPTRDILGLTPKRVLLAGSFGMGVTAVASSHSGTWTKTGGGSSQFDAAATASIVGVAGDSCDFALTDGGGPACSGAFSLAHYDATLATRDGGTGWTVTLQPHTITGGGVTITQNVTAKSAIVMYESGVSTRALINAAINASSSNIYVLSAGAATGALTAAADGYAAVALSTTPATVAASDGVAHVVCYFTNASSTVANCKTALAANPAASALMTFSGGTGATVLATDDHFAATALSGGVDAVAISNIRGKGYSVSKTGTGQYTVTTTDVWPSGVMVVASLQLATADDKFVIVGPFTPTSFVLTIWDKSAGAAADVAVGANNRLNFIVYVANAGTM